MGQKTNPIGNRLGYIRGWESNWFGGNDFGDKVAEDYKIRKYLKVRLVKASISRIAIERTLKVVTITIHTSRPGIIIGKGGQEVETLKEEIKKLTGKEIQINIFEIKLAKSLFFFPFVVSPVVVGLIFSWFYNPKYGLLDSFLELFGLQPLALLSDENLANYGIIAAAMWPQIAYCLILYITGLAALNKEIIESAKIDGARGWGMFWNIILPQLRPATFIAVVVSVLGALRSFDLVAIMTQGGPWGSTTVLAYEMVEQAIFNYRMGYGAALATILFLILDVYIVWFLIRVWKNEKGRL